MKHFVRILTLSLALMMLSLSLVACVAPAKDPAKAESALKEAEYTVAKDDTVVPAIFKGLGYDLTSVVSATKTEKGEDDKTVVDHVTIYYFKDKDAATKAMEKIKEYESADKKEEEDSNWVAATQSGAMIYYGTKAAIKAAR